MAKHFVGAVVCLWVSIASVAGQELSDRTIYLPTDWSVGTSFDLIIEKQRQVIREGRLSKHHSVTSEATVSVLRRSPDGCVLRWIYTDIAVDEDVELAPIVEQFAKIMRGIVFELETDEYGTVYALANEDVRVVATVRSDGRKIDKTGHETFLFRRVGGTWKVVHTHSSTRSRKT
jgi:hypothetical protein